MTHDNTNTQTFRKTSTYAMVVTALMAAVTCILAPLSVPIGPVPISLTNFAIYLPMAIIAGIVIDKFTNRGIQILGMIVGTAICYAFGTAWFCLQAGYTVGAALAVCVIPFIPADLCKMVIAMIIGPMVRKRLGTVAQQ